MGNRAYVVFEDTKQQSRSPVIYLHWNGGPESVYAMLDELDRLGVRADQEYEAARFVQIAANFLSSRRGDEYDTLSLGILNFAEADMKNYDLFDNGVYLVCREGKQRRVRRFRYPGNHTDTPRFLTEMEVERERKAAYKHAYHADADGGIVVELRARTELVYVDKSEPKRRGAA